MLRGIRIGFALLLAAALFPPVAGASNLSISGSRIDYLAAAGETNNLQVTRLGANYVFTEVGGIPITPAAPCANAGANVGTCPAAGIRDIDISLNNMDDTLNVAPTIVSAQIEDTNLFGGPGTDSLTGGPNVENSIQGGDGTDTLTGGSLHDDIAGLDGIDTLNGGGGDDFLRVEGDTFPDSASGGPGNDTLSGATEDPDGADIYAGGPGRDRLSLQGRRDDLLITMNGVADDGGGGCPGVGCENDNVGADLEIVETGQGHDTITGAAGSQTIEGSAGNDIINGAAGDDEVSGSLGDDTVLGGPGNDFVIGAEGTDQIRGNAGDDYLIQFDLFDGERDVFDGGSGIDEMGGFGGEISSGLRIDLDGRADDGPRAPEFDGLRDNVRGNVEGLEGTPRADILIGNGRANELEGGGGADRLVGKGGADGIEGDRGNDNISAGKGRDSITGDGGADRIRSRDKSPDEISCGSSRDLVIADRRDRPGADCDRVRR